MAANARGRRTLILSADVARRAIKRGVHAGERESRALEVIEFRTQPVVDGMALFALDRKRGCRSCVAGGRGLLISLLVARVALSGQSLKLPDSTTLVAIGTVQRGVPADEWKTILMIVGQL